MIQTSRTKRLLLTSSAFLICSFAWAGDAQLWVISGVTPRDATADGSIVVGENGATGQYFEWTAAGGIVDIGGAAAGNGVGGQPSISDDGMFVAGTNLNVDSGFFELSRYVRATQQWTSYGGLGSSSGNSASSGWGLAGNGEHIVGLGWLNAGEAHAVQWNVDTGVVDLGSSVAGESSRANAVDFDGNVVVGWQDGAGRQGAVWDNGEETVILTDALESVGEAGAVSGDGIWVTGIGVDSTDNQAWRWSQDGGVEPLGSLGLPGFPPPRGFGTAINGDGSVIIGFDRGFGPPTSGEGWIWTEADGLVLLNDYFASLGITTDDNLRFSLPLGISADGRTFVGIGRSDTVFSAGWIVTLPVQDEDSDGVEDSTDNCTIVSNANQLDSNEDGIGNACDPDIGGVDGAGADDCIVNFLDLSYLSDAYLSVPGDITWNPDADFSGPDGEPDNVINAFDTFVFGQYFLNPPGPSASGCDTGS